MKYNLSVLKDEKVCFILDKDSIYYGKVKKVKSKENKVYITLEDCIIELNGSFLRHCFVVKHNDTIGFHYGNRLILSSIVSFTMFTSFGFPEELTVEELKQKFPYLQYDSDGYKILMELQKKKSSGTFKTKSEVF